MYVCPIRNLPSRTRAAAAGRCKCRFAVKMTVAAFLGQCWFLFFIWCAAGPLARARAAVEAFHQQAFDFAADAGTLRRLCPSLGLARSERVVAALSAAPRLALVNATSFLLLVVTLADAAAEVGG